MPITDMIPWKRKEPESEPEERALQVSRDAFLSFPEQMNRLFDDFFRSWGLDPFGAAVEGWGAFSPNVDVVETDKEIKVAVELPGLDEEDIDVNVTQGVLTISGEKRQEKEEKRHNYVRTERSYGSFRRSLALPAEVEPGKADAVFRKGVLTVTLPKTGGTEARKRITIKAK
jgi:HSP20 family protein